MLKRSGFLDRLHCVYPFTVESFHGLGCAVFFFTDYNPTAPVYKLARLPKVSLLTPSAAPVCHMTLTLQVVAVSNNINNKRNCLCLANWLKHPVDWPVELWHVKTQAQCCLDLYVQSCSWVLCWLWIISFVFHMMVFEKIKTKIF